MSLDFLPDFWAYLKQYTSARIALGRAGGSVPTKESLEFRLAHARARDAVKKELDADALMAELNTINVSSLALQSHVEDKQSYLLFPHLGRRLNPPFKQQLTGLNQVYDICLVASDGLSPLAIETHLKPLLRELLPVLADLSYTVSPVYIVKYGRVAVGDDIADAFNSKMVIVCIGERPGLTTNNSMGIYMTYLPQLGITDERRNCISNIHSGGLNYVVAADKLIYLIREAFRRGLSGVELKDERKLL